MNQTTLYIIGDETAVLGFALLGMEGRAVHTVEEARGALGDARTNMQSGILFITEEWADTMRDDVDRLKASTLEPLLVEIPGSQPGRGNISLRTLVQNALGIRLEI